MLWRCPAGRPAGTISFCADASRLDRRLAFLSRQCWYLDDGLFRGNAKTLGPSFSQLERSLHSAGLKINHGKCEIYAKTAVPDLPLCLAGIPVITDHGKWTYLGAPLCETTDEATSEAVAKMEDLRTALRPMGQQFPLQALQLLRYTTGVCRVELSSDIAQASSRLLRAGISDILWLP